MISVWTCQKTGNLTNLRHRVHQKHTHTHTLMCAHESQAKLNGETSFGCSQLARPGSLAHHIFDTYSFNVKWPKNPRVTMVRDCVEFLFPRSTALVRLSCLIMEWNIIGCSGDGDSLSTTNKVIHASAFIKILCAVCSIWPVYRMSGLFCKVTLWLFLFYV